MVEPESGKHLGFAVEEALMKSNWMKPEKRLTSAKARYHFIDGMLFVCVSREWCPSSFSFLPDEQL